MAIQQGRNIEKLLIIAFLLCALIIAFIIVALGARLRSEIPIAYGYRILRNDSSSVVLADSRGYVVVGQQIREIDAVNGLIIGRTVDPGIDAHPGWSFPVGYFIVDSRNGKVTAGLTKNELMNITGRSPVMRSILSWSLFN